MVSRLNRGVQRAFRMPAVYSPTTGGSLEIDVSLRVRELEVEAPSGGTIFTQMTEAVFLKEQISSVSRGDRFTFDHDGSEYAVSEISEETENSLSAFVDKI